MPNEELPKPEAVAPMVPSVRDTIVPDDINLSVLRNAYGDDETRRMLTLTRIDLTDARTDDQIVASRGWPLEVVTALRALVYQRESVALGQSAEQTFIDYALHQEGCIRDLNDLIPILEAGEKTAGQVVAAIKAKSDIYERVIKMGQELDIIAKAPKRTETVVIDGVNVANLPDGKLKSLIIDISNKLQKLNKKYGDFDEIEVQAVEMPNISRELSRRGRKSSGAVRAAGGKKTTRNNIINRIKAI
jgi:hypothetical protein